MYQKYFAWSFDDGLEQDRRIVKTLKNTTSVQHFT